MKRKWSITVILLGFILANAACGYKVRSSVGTLPDELGSLGIPTFQNYTNEYKVEQLITKAVLKEFNIRTRLPIVSKKTGVDAVLQGEITSVASTPVTFSAQSFGSAFIVTLRTRVKLIRLKDSHIIWQKNDYSFRGRYTLNKEVRDFFSEENPTLERLAQDFATSLVSTILESQPLDPPKP